MMKFLKTRMTLGESGIIHLIPLLLLLAGIAGGTYLVQKNGFQIFNPKAASQNVELVDGSCVKTQSGAKVLTCGSLSLKFISPVDTGQITDSGPNLSTTLSQMSLVKTAYANHKENIEDWYCDETKIRHSLKYSGWGDWFIDFVREYHPEVRNCALYRGTDGKDQICKEFKSPPGNTSTDVGCVNQTQPIVAPPAPAPQPLPPGAPQVSKPINKSPPNNAKYNLSEDGTITLSWTGIANAAYYAVTITNKGTFNTKGDTTSSTRNVSEFESDKINSWQVFALDSNIRQIGEGSDITQFTVHKTQGSSNTNLTMDKRTIRWYCKDNNIWREYNEYRPEGAVGTYVNTEKEEECGQEECKLWENTDKARFPALKKGDNDAKCVAKGTSPNAVADTARGNSPISNTSPAISESDQRTSGSQCGKVCVYSEGSTCYEGNCLDGSLNCGFNNNCGFISKNGCSTGTQVLCPGTNSPAQGSSGNTSAPLVPGTEQVTTCKGERKTWSQIDAELRAAAYNGAFSHTPTELDAYNNVVCPTAPDDCVNFKGPPAGKGDTPTGYEWRTSCTKSCLKNDDCPVSTDPSIAGDPNIRKITTDNPKGALDKTRWCYGFGANQDQPRCLMLWRKGSPGAPGASAAPAAPAASTVATTPNPKTTIGVRFSETASDLSDENSGWRPYSKDMIVPYVLNNPTPGTKFIFVQFRIKDSQGKITISKANPYPLEIQLVSTTSTGTSSGAVIPSGSDCKLYETDKVCGIAGFKTYDKCTDNLGGSNKGATDTLCSGAATTFYCEGSTNSRCISATDRKGHYSCSACPSLQNKGASGTSLIGTCQVTATTVNVNTQVTYKVGMIGGNGRYTYSWGGEIAKQTSGTSNTSDQVNKSFSSVGSKQVWVTIGSGSEEFKALCPLVTVSQVDSGGSNERRVTVPVTGSCPVTASCCFDPLQTCGTTDTFDGVSRDTSCPSGYQWCNNGYCIKESYNGSSC